MDQNLRVPDIFGCDVFNEKAMAAYLSAPCFQTWKECVDTGSELPLDAANEIAEAMKNWAVDKGATHFTHWFQPMTGITAEKHDAFIHPTGDGNVIMEFSGRQLIKGEPDASSFPSGGLRAAFEARGYTAWDPTAFAFIKDGSLYIPTCFFSYTGESLDKKTPLLRSVNEVSREALRVLRLLGDEEVQRVKVCVGAEQEYFLIPNSMYAQRDDLRLTGRTLFGAASAKGQELGTHYYAALRSQVSEMMKEVDQQLWRLGVLAKTKHNEAAPCQHELAPIYSEAGHACDSNQLIMEILKKCAAKHDLVCLLHEKPFAGINGSGKHNNWSLTTDTGRNLFHPGKTPKDNAQFLLFLAALLKGIDEYQDLLRCTVATAGNDHRLGGHEAPPAIISICLGDELTTIVNSIITGNMFLSQEKGNMRIGLDAMPAIPRDTADRNRTSPLAFTGNKFEFRMLGASASIAAPNIVLNTIMAEELCQFSDYLEAADDRNVAMQELVCDTLKKYQKIIFNGNGYSSQWKEEAFEQGLHNYTTAWEALPHFIDQKNVGLMTRRGIFTEAEFRARYEICLDNYCKTVKIEAKTMVDMVLQQILPAVLSYSASLATGAKEKEQMQLPNHAEVDLAQQISESANRLYRSCCLLAESLEAIPGEKEAAAKYFGNEITSQMHQLRQHADLLERLTAKTHWPFPTYSDILFY